MGQPVNLHKRGKAVSVNQPKPRKEWNQKQSKCRKTLKCAISRFICTSTCTFLHFMVVCMHYVYELLVCCVHLFSDTCFLVYWKFPNEGSRHSYRHTYRQTFYFISCAEPFCSNKMKSIKGNISRKTFVEATHVANVLREKVERT